MKLYKHLRIITFTAWSILITNISFSWVNISSARVPVNWNLSEIHLSGCCFWKRHWQNIFLWQFFPEGQKTWVCNRETLTLWKIDGYISNHSWAMIYTDIYELNESTPERAWSSLIFAKDLLYKQFHISKCLSNFCQKIADISKSLK